MTSPRYYDFKHYVKSKKYLIAGCGAVLLELTLGAANVQAAKVVDNTQSTNQALVNRVAKDNADSEVELQSETPNEQAGELAPDGDLNKNETKSGADTSEKSEERDKSNDKSESIPVSSEDDKKVTSKSGQSHSVVKEDENKDKISTLPSVKAKERVIYIHYYDRYTDNGVKDTSGDVGHVHHTKAIEQLADKNGDWAEFDWDPTDNGVSFEDGIQPKAIKIDKTQANSYYQIVHVYYFVRSVDIPDDSAKSGKRVVSDTYVIKSGDTIEIPELDLGLKREDIPAPYKPRLSIPGPDEIVEENGHYYLTGGTVTVATGDTPTVTYQSSLYKPDGHHEQYKREHQTTRQYKVVYTAPISVEFDNLKGEKYNGFADKTHGVPAYYKDTLSIDYGQSLDSDSLVKLGQRYLGYYVNYVGNKMKPGENPKIVGYFDSEGMQTDMSQLALEKGTDPFKLRFAVADPAWVPVDGSQTTKTRTIVLHNTPTGDQTITQSVTFQQVEYQDKITRQRIGNQSKWQVQSGTNTWSDLTSTNHSWAEYNAPEFAGYTHTPSSSTIAAQVVDQNTDNTRIDIVYTPVNNSNPGDNDNPGNNDKPSQPNDNPGDNNKPGDNNMDLPEKPNIDDSDNNNQNRGHNAGKHENGTKNSQKNSNGSINGSVVEKGGQQVVGTPLVKAAAQKSATKLPQTGNQGLLATLGLAISSLIAALGLGYRKKN